MKKHILLLGVVLTGAGAFAQQIPTNTAPGGAGPSGQNNAQFWSRAGNNNFPVGNTNNIFGTLWNSPIYTQTFGVNRMKLNGSVAYAVNGFPGARNGYLLLGDGSGLSAPLFTGATTGAYSQLHLTGNDGAFIPSGGYRPWMKTGITLTDNQDLSYFGVRNVLLDVNETVIAWSDNAGTSGSGPDDMVFRFLSGDGGTINTTDLISDADLDGLHIARFTGVGNFGLGNTFGSPVGPLYVTPQSLAHYSLSNLRSVWQQFTNRNVALGSGTSETASDGLRIGIIGNTNLNVNGTAAIYNQENRHLLFSTNANTTTMNVLKGATQERMRITSIGAPTNLVAGGMGVNNPAGLGTNLTRVAISHNPSQPVTRPLSLLHLGYNTGLSSTPLGSTDGWRTWMDIGTYTTNGTDNIYVGLKNEGADRSDAVINWGDNQNGGLAGGVGPDHLRFIFTSTTTGFPAGDPESESNNGLEVARMEPGLASTLPNTNYGMVGIGNFSPGSLNITGGIPVDAKLDIDGDLRIRQVTQDDNLTRVLVIDPADLNRVHWKVINTNSGFVPCTDNSGAADLLSDSKINHNNQNFYFENNDLLNENHVGIGYSCTQILPAKLSVKQIHPFTVNENTTAIFGLNNDVTNTILTTYTGVEGIADGEHPPFLRSTNRGGAFFGSGADVNYGVYAEAKKATNENWQNIGGNFVGTDGIVSIGLWGTGRNGELRSIGVSGQATSPNNVGNPPSTLENIGGQFVGSFSDGNNYGVYTVASGGASAYGIYSTANGGSANWAGYFDGVLETTQPTVITSDAQFKTEVNKIENALGIISKLQPKTYMMDTVNFEQFQFSNVNQFGFIAQEVEDVLPELIHNSIHPGVYDSLGTEIIAPLEYKAMNYNAIIPINTQAIKELNAKIDRSTLSDETIKENVSDLSGSLDKVLEMRGVNYSWSQNGQDNYGLDSLIHIGYIAQEMNQIDPLLTFIDSDTLMHVRYDKVVPIITESIQELNTKIEVRDSIIDAQGDLITDLNNRLTQLENCLSGILPFLCQMSNSAIQPTQEEVQNQLRTAINVNLSDRNAIVLNQNVPNPFAESTVITFTIPASVQKAQVHFYDGQGKLINSVDVIERGNGQLNVFANNLSTGVYTYSLVADGQIVATKRMVKEELTSNKKAP